VNDVVIGNADVVRGEGQKMLPDVMVLRGGKVVTEWNVTAMADRFVPEEPGTYVVRVAFYTSQVDRTGSYTIRAAYGVAPLDLLTW
jgi:hypothetical protein